MQGDWNAKVGMDAHENWQGICRNCCNEEKKTKAVSDSRSLPPLTVLCWRTLLVITKHPHGWTWQCQNWQRHYRINYVLMRKRFRLGVNIARTWSFPGADIGSEHDLEMITFHLRLKRVRKPKRTRLKFDLEKLKDPNVLKTFQDMIGGKLLLLTIVNNEDDHHLEHSSDWNSQPVRSLENIAIRRNSGSLQIFLKCTIKGENWEEKIQGRCKTLRGARNRQRKTGQKNSVVKLKKILGKTRDTEPL